MRATTIGLISTNYVHDDFDELTESRTLPTLMFGGKYRLIDFAISNMVNAGINAVGVISHYKYRSLADHISNGKPWGLARKKGGLFMLPGSVYASREKGNRFLVRDLLDNHIFFDKEKEADYVILCDGSTVMNIDFRAFIENHQQSGDPVTLLCKSMPERTDGRFLEVEDGHVKAFSRAGWGSDLRFLNCMIIDRQYLVNGLERYGAMDFSDLMEVFDERIGYMKVGYMEYDGFVGVIESLNDYMRVSQKLLDEDVRAELFDGERKIYTTPQDRTPTIYRPGSVVKNSLVSAGCVIEGRVENSIISRNTYVGKGAVVKDCIILQKGRIEEGAYIRGVISDKSAVISKGVRLEAGADRPIVIAKESTV